MTRKITVTALFDYTGTDESSLSFKKGDTILVLTRLPSGWWDGVLNGQRGWFPSNFVSSPEISNSLFPGRLDDVSTKLPPNWGIKKTSDNRTYYYNILTDETRWEINDSTEAQPRSLRLAPTVVNELESTWIGFAKFIASRVNYLTYAIDVAWKDKFIGCSSDIVEAVRVLLVATETLNTESHVFISHPVIKVHHRHIITSLSKMVLAAKTASSLWPPPDSREVLRTCSVELLLALRNFIKVAETEKLKLVPQPTPLRTETAISDSGASQSKEIVALLANSMESINESIQGLDFTPKDEKRSTIITTSVIQTVRGIVSQVGDFLCTVDELPQQLIDADLKNHRLGLYNAISSLVMATRNASLRIPPNDAVEQLCNSTEQIEKNIKSLFISAKLCAAEEEKSEHDILQSILEPEPPTEVKSAPIASPTGMLDSQPPQKVQAIVSAGPILRSELQYKAFNGKVENLNPNPKKIGVGNSGDNGRLAEHRPSITSITSPISANFVISPGAESFLEPDFDPTDVIFTPEGQIKAATLKCLVEKLTMHDSVDPNFTSQFLITYRSFASSHQLFELLKERFLLHPPRNLNSEEYQIWQSKKLTPVRLRTFNVFKLWMENHMLEEDLSILNLLTEFAMTTMTDEMPKVAAHLLRVVEKRKANGLVGSLSRISFTMNQKEIPNSILPKALRNFKILDLDTLELARQITLMESSLFQKLQPSEFLNKAWSCQDKSAAKNVKNMISRSNQITRWVTNSILQERDVRKRSKLLIHFITLAERVSALNNYSSLMTILASFSSAPIHRLKKTWEYVPSKMIASLDQLKTLMNTVKNYQSYRIALRNTNPPCIPFLGCYLTDITFLEDGNSNLFKDTNLINFAKMAKIADVIREIQQFQQTSYNLKIVPEITSWLLKELYSAPSVETLYETSLLLEPREVK